MTATFITITQINVFDQGIFIIITDLRKKHKCADIDNIYSEIIKPFEFKDTTKEYLQDRIDPFIINEKISNKKTGIWTVTQIPMTQKK